MSARVADSETSPLLNLPNGHEPAKRPSKARAIIWSLVTIVFAAAVVLMTAANAGNDSLRVWLGMMPYDADLAADVILKTAPVIVSDVARNVEGGMLIVFSHPFYLFGVPLFIGRTHWCVLHGKRFSAGS